MSSEREIKSKDDRPSLAAVATLITVVLALSYFFYLLFIGGFGSPEDKIFLKDCYNRHSIKHHGDVSDDDLKQIAIACTKEQRDLVRSRHN